MGGKRPDTSAQEALMAKQMKQIDEQRAENKRIQAEAAEKEATEKARLDDLKQRQRRGKRGLLGTEGDELGVS